MIIVLVKAHFSVQVFFLFLHEIYVVGTDYMHLSQYPFYDDSFYKMLR